MSVTSQSDATMNIVFAGNLSPTSASLGANSNADATDLESQVVTDPRAKKRLQNRVAQRSYRKAYLALIAACPIVANSREHRASCQVPHC